jgi:hypothetical protein
MVIWAQETKDGENHRQHLGFIPRFFVLSVCDENKTQVFAKLEHIKIYIMKSLVLKLLFQFWVKNPENEINFPAQIFLRSITL